MTSKQKHLIVLILGVELGLVLFLIFSSHPVLSAWWPGTPDPTFPIPPTVFLPSPTLPPTLPLGATEVSPISNETENPPEIPISDEVQAVPTPFPTALPLLDLGVLARSYPETFAETPPIWAHDHLPDPHEILLFRHAFEVPDTSNLTELQIFADTRYEVWLDGVWIGRGPARFSCTLREYDIFPLENLKPGRHLLAVLVQWAPNARRSESNTPLLQARVQTYTATGPLPLTQTSPAWNVYVTSAWNPDSGLVHDWELIGPMEWLDFRALPQNWTSPDFSDAAWGKAVLTRLSSNTAQNPTLASRICSRRHLDASFIPVYQPRSIPPLTHFALIPALTDAGNLSPNRLTYQPLTTENSSSIPFNVTSPTVFTVEVLALSGSANMTNTVRLDSSPLGWLPAGETRPGVWIGRLPVDAGLHTLTNQNLKTFPMFSVFTTGLQETLQGLLQGHPGHRMLLAEPVSNNSAISILSGPGLNLRVEQTPAYLLLELPFVTHGRLLAEVSGPPGTIVDIGWDEKRYLSPENPALGRPLPFPGALHPNWSQVDSWIMDGNYRNLSTLDTRTGRYIVIAIWGPGPVEFHNLRVEAEHYPTTSLGALTTDSALLNQIWQVGALTARINMIDAYADPWRERGQWWGDAYVVDRTNRVAFGDVALLRRGLQYMADAFDKGVPAAFAPSGEDVHVLDYGMLWVQSLDAYATLTQDQAFVSEVYPTLQTFLAYLKQKTSGGLLNITPSHWSQSTYLDTRATFSRHGQSAAVNAVYYGTLQSAARLADLVGDGTSADAWRTQAETVKEQVNAKLYNPVLGRYHATYLYGKRYEPDVFAQAWPLAYDLVPEAEIPRVVFALQEFISDDPQNSTVEIYGMNWVLEGLARHGYISETLDIMELYYGYMLNAGATTWWETFTYPERYTAAHSHGWGSSPTWILSTYLLGGRWTGPDAWQVRPALEGVTTASGAIPIGENTLAISWEVKSCSVAEIVIRAPSHTSGELVLPFTDVVTLTMNGAVIWREGMPLLPELTIQADGFHISLAKRPEYQFTVEHTCP